MTRTHGYNVIYHMTDGRTESTVITAINRYSARKRATEKQKQTVGDWPVIRIDITRLYAKNSKY